MRFLLASNRDTLLQWAIGIVQASMALMSIYPFNLISGTLLLLYTSEIFSPSSINYLVALQHLQLYVSLIAPQRSNDVASWKLLNFTNASLPYLIRHYSSASNLLSLESVSPRQTKISMKSNTVPFTRMFGSKYVCPDTGVNITFISHRIIVTLKCTNTEENLSIKHYIFTSQCARKSTSLV